MKAVAVVPGQPGSVHLADLTRPSVEEVPPAGDRPWVEDDTWAQEGGPLFAEGDGTEPGAEPVRPSPGHDPATSPLPRELR